MVSDVFIIYIYYPEFLYVKPASRECYFKVLMYVLTKIFNYIVPVWS